MYSDRVNLLNTSLKSKRKNSFRTTWKDYLSFSTRERNGLYVLLIIFLIQISFNFYLNHSKQSYTQSDAEWLTDSVASWMKFREEDDAGNSSKQFGKYDKVQKKNVELFKFNPNHSTYEELLSLGLRESQVKMILKYRAYGKGFRIKSDFKKMYCISPAEYLKLETWIDLPDSLEYKVKHENVKVPPKEFLTFDLSTADTLDLIKLSGIGPAFSRRIINYRKRLGGYAHLSQLLEVWGMTDTLYQKILPHLFISDSIPKSIPVNSIDIKEFGKHPYVGFSLAKVILNYRDQHGLFKSIEEFKKVPLVTEEIFIKLSPYLDINY